MISSGLGCFWTYVASCVFLATSVPVVRTSGQPEVSLNDSLVVGVQSGPVSFLGIPYATPPTGQLRFKQTVPLTSLPAIINATVPKPQCVSVPPEEGQSEDCLYLNIWVPANATGASPLAVLVWIHGGGFITGSSLSPPGNSLAGNNDIIVVTINYRLGPLGFLSTEDGASRGNYGLWDQHTAIQWIKDNIAAFGGDPTRITLIGESAGGKSVSFQVLSPYSGHLFQRAIIQSGTAHCPTSLQWKPLETAFRLGRAMGCQNDSNTALVDCLRQKPALDMATAAAKLWDDDAIRKLIDFGWAPVVDEDFVPQLYSREGTPTQLTSTFTGSLMLGVNNNEGALLKLWQIPLATKLDQDIETKLRDPQFYGDKFIPEVLAQMFKSLPEDPLFFTNAAEVIRHKYTDWSTPNTTIAVPDLYNAVGEQAYVSCSFQFLSQWLSAHRESGSGSELGKVFVYVFDNYPEVRAEEGLAGMKHGDDVYYTFGFVGAKLRSIDGVLESVIAKETELADNFQKLLTNFAKSGSPATPEPLPLWPTWPVYDLEQQHYLSISDTPRVSTRYKAANLTLWTDLVRTIVKNSAVAPLTCPGTQVSDSSADHVNWHGTLNWAVLLVALAVVRQLL